MSAEDITRAFGLRPCDDNDGFLLCGGVYGTVFVSADFVNPKEKFRAGRFYDFRAKVYEDEEIAAELVATSEIIPVPKENSAKVMSDGMGMFKAEHVRVFIGRKISNSQFIGFNNAFGRIFVSFADLLQFETYLFDIVSISTDREGCAWQTSYCYHPAEGRIQMHPVVVKIEQRLNHEMFDAYSAEDNVSCVVYNSDCDEELKEGLTLKVLRGNKLKFNTASFCCFATKDVSFVPEIKKQITTSDKQRDVLHKIANTLRKKPEVLNEVKDWEEFQEMLRNAL
jgi:hypothetical protein